MRGHDIWWFKSHKSIFALLSKLEFQEQSLSRVGFSEPSFSGLYIATFFLCLYTQFTFIHKSSVSVFICSILVIELGATYSHLATITSGKDMYKNTVIFQHTEDNLSNYIQRTCKIIQYIRKTLMRQRIA